MLKNGIFCEMVILVVFKGFLVVKNLEILVQIVPERPIYYYRLSDNFSKLPPLWGGSVSPKLVQLEQKCFLPMLLRVYHLMDK